MPVSSILGYLSSGMATEEILRQWPELEAEDIYQALGYQQSQWKKRASWLGAISRHETAYIGRVNQAFYPKESDRRDASATNFNCLKTIEITIEFYDYIKDMI